MKNRILFVSTCSYLSKSANKIANEFNLDLFVYEGGIMKDGHKYAKNNENNYDVIISQGSTADAIKSLVSIPVVAVEVKTVDFIKALYKAKTYGNKIGLITFKSESVSDLEVIREMLNIDFTVFPYYSKEEYIIQINNAISMGVQTLVGTGDCLIEHINDSNLKFVTINNDIKQLYDSFNVAKNICDLAQREEEKAERFKTIIDYSADGIIALDNKNVVVTYNPTAEKIFNIKATEILEKPIHNNINSMLVERILGDGNMLLNKIININSKQFLMNRLPIIISNEMFSLVMTFQDVSKLQELEQKVRSQLYKKGLVARYNFSDIKGESLIIKNTIKQAKMIAKTNTTVLILGETGSGKELFAQSIHNFSSRSKGPFVAINCAAMPENLLESELFGYEEGAFTGAKKGGKPGIFELAHGGTIFLDEISEIPLSLQGRLLRVLQEREVLRIGGDYILNVNIRVITATNANLFNLMKEGKFRQDLYFRLNILDLRIPPIRERKEDLSILVNEMIQKMNSKHNTSIENISENAMQLLLGYGWPGNVRELENFTEKMCVLSDKNIINEELVRRLLENYSGYSFQEKEPIENPDKITVNLGNLKDIENQVIMQANKLFKNDKNYLAEKLGISRTTLWKKLKELEKSDKPTLQV